MKPRNGKHYTPAELYKLMNNPMLLKNEIIYIKMDFSSISFILRYPISITKGFGISHFTPFLKDGLTLDKKYTPLVKYLLEHNPIEEICDKKNLCAILKKSNLLDWYIETYPLDELLELKI